MEEQHHNPHESGGSYLKQLENWFEENLGRKAPQLPEKWREIIVKIAPWVTLIVMILALPAILIVLGLGTVLTPFAYLGGVTYGAGYMISMGLLIVSLILEVMAIPGLFKRSLKGWRFAYWATLVSALSYILGLEIVSLIGTVLSLYILFQVKKLYR